MSCTIQGATQLGVDCWPVQVETQIIGSLKRFTIIGLPDSILKESKDRIRCAIENSGFSFPNREVIVSLAPADLPKRGAGFDLPIALCVLAACGHLPERELAMHLAFGELNLDGSVKDLAGSLAAVLLGRDLGKCSIVPNGYLKRSVAGESLAQGDSLVGVSHLSQAVSYLREGKVPENKIEISAEPATIGSFPCFGDVAGQASAKRCLELAAAGGHNVLMIGPPGSGKSMLAERTVSIIPPLGLEEQVEVSKIRESVGMIERESSSRPFRAPHHTTSYAGLIGGGSVPSAGEVSLAHRGILFLDELPEFKKSVLETLRQPLEKKEILISRANRQLAFPSDFTLIAAMNPCPCGYFGSRENKDSARVCRCECSRAEIKRYTNRISGPLLDRIDIFIWVRPVQLSMLQQAGDCSTESLFMRDRVEEAIKFQQERYKSSLVKNSSLSGKKLKEHCKLSKEAECFLRQEAERLDMSSRGYVRTLRLARTIADLSGGEEIKLDYLAEAVRYRMPPELFNG